MEIKINLVIGLDSAVMALLASAAKLSIPAGTKPAAVPSSPAPAAAGAAPSAAPAAVVADGEKDAEGHPWSEALHASTKSKTKAGLWRMKVGVTRPEPAAGFAKVGDSEGTGTSVGGTASNATGSATTGGVDDDDEFAAFAKANAAASGADASAAASAPVRTWSDADLSKLCNEAAIKLGSPDKIKATIAEYVPTGEVAHSRNIAADKREAFAKAIETAAGITFAG